jgi:hypothetical protein
MKPKNPARRTANQVQVPLPPVALVREARSTPVTGARKRPSALRANSAACDSQGKAGRAEIRREEPRRSAPRNTIGTAERGNQRRSHKSGRKSRSVA